MSICVYCLFLTLYVFPPKQYTFIRFQIVDYILILVIRVVLLNLKVDVYSNMNIRIAFPAA